MPSRTPPCPKPGRLPIRRLGALLTGVALAVGLPAAAPSLATASAPEPAPVPTVWEFDFDQGPLRLVSIDVPGVGPRQYFYLTYTVTNFWGGSLLYAPDFYMLTDEGQITRSGVDVPPVVTETIVNMLRNPLIETQTAILGEVQEGIENARSGVVIWPATDLDVDEISVFVANLSGENQQIWVRDPETRQRKRIVLRKTLMLRYETPGDLTARGARPFELAERRWVMR